MNCTTCQYELSMCLDGRLPSGRRTVVMHHVDECERCATFWSELQAAQKLALLLPRERVSEGFREQLWERIRAGEGTPEAVFHEPVPLLAKVRYVLTGAAAAAVVLLCARLFRDEPAAAPKEEQRLATIDSAPAPNGGARLRTVANGGGALQPREETFRFEDTPLVSSAQRLTTDVFALEAARQLEQRHANAQFALRRLGDDVAQDGTAVDQVLRNASEFRTFGECLLDLRDRKRLRFDGPDVEADLRYAVKMLGANGLQRRDVGTVRDIVTPALQSSHFGHLSKLIALTPLNPREERDVLYQFNAQRPEVFPMLFFVIGSEDELRDSAFLRQGQAFMFDDPCGATWVAPLSEVAAREVHIHIRTGR